MLDMFQYSINQPCEGICNENTVWSQQTHTHEYWCFSIMLCCFYMSCQAWQGSLVQPMRVMMFCFLCLPLSHSHTHTHWFILLLYTLTCSCFLPLFSWQCTPNKMEFGTFAKALSKCQYAPWILGHVNLMMPVPNREVE